MENNKDKFDYDAFEKEAMKQLDGQAPERE
jgi:hypothetical protein